MNASERPGGWAALIPFLMCVIAVAAFGAQFTSGEWYATLRKPSWTPPGWLFGPVWLILYAAIAVAGWRVWRTTGRIVPALIAWGLQLVANALWSWLFFGLHRVDLAAVDIVVLLALIVTFIVAARRYSLLASGLFVPYALWVAFAAALNLSIWRLN